MAVNIERRGHPRDRHAQMADQLASERSVSTETPVTNIAIHATVILLFSISLVVFNIIWKRARIIDVDRFLTARKTFSWVAMCFSFYAASGGAWTLYGIPSYVADLSGGIGLGGLIVLAVVNSGSLSAMSIVGPMINSRFPTITSWNDFASKRFGKGAQALVASSSLLSILACSLQLFFLLCFKFAICDHSK